MASLSDQALALGQRLQWKYILITALAFLALHIILLKDDGTSVGRLPAIVNFQAPSTNPVYDPSKEEPKNSTPDRPAPYDAVSDDSHVAVCISVKDQAEDLVEFFVHHYHHMGIKRFYVMDDGSDPPMSSFNYPGIPRSALTFTYQERATRNNFMQIVFYTWCIERYSDKHTWLAFIDSDEFLDTPGNETFSEVLRSFEHDETVGALGVNWQMHTSNGLLTRPESTRKAFTECIFDDPENGGESTDNNHIKTIIKTKYAGPPINPHKFQTAPNTNTVGEDGVPITSAAWRKPVTRNRIGLHHYAVKSKAEYDEKAHRGNGMTQPKGDQFWKHVEEEIEHVRCEDMVHYDP